MTAANDLSVQMASTSTLILIPARMASGRLPGKSLADVAGMPMIVQVLRRAGEAKIGRAVVATDTDEIANAVKAHGGAAVMTRADHPSGWTAFSRRSSGSIRTAKSRRSSICREISDHPAAANSRGA